MSSDDSGWKVSMSISPVVRTTLVDELARRLLEHIAQAGYAVDDRLPPLSALAERFGVSIPTLREVVRRLESSGVLTVRHGSGVYLAADAERVVLSNPSLSGLSEQTMLELLDARLVIEPELAGRAATRRDPNRLDELRTIDELCAQAISAGDVIRLNELNMRFHVLVGQAAGNRVLAESLQTIIEVHEGQQHRIAELFADAERDRAQHAGIHWAIIAGDAEGARKLMHEHLTDVLAVIERRLLEQEAAG